MNDHLATHPTISLTNSHALKLSATPLLKGESVAFASNLNGFLDIFIRAGFNTALGGKRLKLLDLRRLILFQYCTAQLRRREAHGNSRPLGSDAAKTKETGARTVADTWCNERSGI